MKLARRVEFTGVNWPVRLIVAARAVTIGLAYYLVVGARAFEASFVAILGSIVTFDIYVALESRRHSLVGIVRALETTGPRALATARALLTGLAVGLIMGLLTHLGLPIVLAAVATGGVVYSLAERTPNNISAFVALVGGLNLFQRVAELPRVAPAELLPAVWPVTAAAFRNGFVALSAGLLVGMLMGFLTRLWLPRAYRSRRSLAYPELPEPEDTDRKE
ncbi:MAG: hypothetical protein ACM3RP_08705 [Chitinophagales bacterium]